MAGEGRWIKGGNRRFANRSTRPKLVDKSCQYRIMKKEVNPVCKVWNHFEETTEHNISVADALNKQV